MKHICFHFLDNRPHFKSKQNEKDEIDELDQSSSFNI